MTENLTKAKELYQDIATALSSQNAEIDRKEVLRLAFELFLLVEHGEKLCVERGKIKPRSDEHIGDIIERCTKALEKNQEGLDKLAAEQPRFLRPTAKDFKVVQDEETP